MNWFTRLLGKRNDPDEYMTLAALAEHTSISLGAIRMAVFDKRLDAKKSGHIWLSTVAAVEELVETGRLRRK